MLIKQFILKTIALVIITSLLCLVIFKTVFPTNFVFLYTALPFLFGLVNILIYQYLSKAEGKTLSALSNRYMLCTTIKLLSSTIFIIVFLLFEKEQVVYFLSTFLTVYLIFLVQEIIGILNFFKKKEKSESTHAKS